MQVQRRRDQLTIDELRQNHFIDQATWPAVEQYVKARDQFLGLFSASATTPFDGCEPLIDAYKELVRKVRAWLPERVDWCRGPIVSMLRVLLRNDVPRLQKVEDLVNALDRVAGEMSAAADPGPLLLERALKCHMELHNELVNLREMLVSP